MGAELRLIITGFQLKLSSVLLVTALSNRFLLLLPLLSLVLLHLLFSTVTSPTSFTSQFSQMSPYFFPVSAHAYYWCHLCSVSAPVHARSLCPPSPPLPVRRPPNPLSRWWCLQVPAHTSLLKQNVGFAQSCENRVPDPLCRKGD